MIIEFFLAAVIILLAFAVFGLIVGVSNDAVNFLNSPIGSRVAPRYVILIVASLGILAGVTFSSGMMEVARKGIFHPQLFTMPELLMIFLGVMLSNIILLDTFNTFGLPTSTTVSIVFGLLGAAVAISAIKIIAADGGLTALQDYINTAEAMIIIFGILFSIVVAFFFGAILQFITRLVFSFDFMPRMKRYGALWAGLTMSSVLYFILVKGAKGASFITPETAQSIKDNAWLIMLYSFIASAMFFQVLLFLKVNILKPLILIGTFALAMAFAANDLVNFIGVPLAGLASYRTASAMDNPLTGSMDALSQKVQTETLLLLLAGVIMVITLWLSKKARTVTETELNLARQDEGDERFESSGLSRIIVRMWLRTATVVASFVPNALQTRIGRRLDSSAFNDTAALADKQRFDLLRASVNLMVASAIISYATSHKLPLSTTYVTFMVAMGSSFADGAWGRESAVYRITGVLVVIGGWFMTALASFVIALLVSAAIYYSKLIAIPVLLVIIAVIIWKNHLKHEERAITLLDDRVYNLKKIKDAPSSIIITFEQMGYLIEELRMSLDKTLSALFNKDLPALRRETKALKRTQNWTNIITANILKSMRLLQKREQVISHRYAETIRCLQIIADCQRDIVVRAKMHVDNQHKRLIPEQREDLKQVRRLMSHVFKEVEQTFSNRQVVDYASVYEKHQKLATLVDELNNKQISRIVSEASKTRLTILFYALVQNSLTISKQSLNLIKIFEESFGKLSDLIED